MASNEKPTNEKSTLESFSACGEMLRMWLLLSDLRVWLLLWIGHAWPNIITTMDFNLLFETIPFTFMICSTTKITIKFSKKHVRRCAHFIHKRRLMLVSMYWCCSLFGRYESNATRSKCIEIRKYFQFLLDPQWIEKTSLSLSRYSNQFFSLIIRINFCDNFFPSFSAQCFYWWHVFHSLFFFHTHTHTRFCESSRKKSK